MQGYILTHSDLKEKTFDSLGYMQTVPGFLTVHTPSTAFRHLPPRKDVVNSCLEFAVCVSHCGASWTKLGQRVNKAAPTKPKLGYSVEIMPTKPSLGYSVRLC